MGLETQAKCVSEAKTKDNQTLSFICFSCLCYLGVNINIHLIGPFVIWPQLPSLVLFYTISSPILSALLALDYFYFSHLPCMYYTFCINMHLMLDLLRATFPDPVPPLYSRPPYICPYSSAMCVSFRFPLCLCDPLSYLTKLECRWDRDNLYSFLHFLSKD